MCVVRRHAPALSTTTSTITPFLRARMVPQIEGGRAKYVMMKKESKKVRKRKWNFMLEPNPRISIPILLIVKFF